MSNRTTVLFFSIAFALLSGMSVLAWSDISIPGRQLIIGVLLIITGVVMVAAEAHKQQAAPQAPITREAKIGIAFILAGCGTFLYTIALA